MSISARNIITIVIIAVSVWMGIWGSADATAACNVLVVYSGHETFPPDRDARAGIEEVLGADCTLTYVYLDALTAPTGIETKAQEAYRQYQALQPDGVIAVGEEAQKSFVVPYLRDKVATPVIFANIMFPEVHGYPAANVSGIRQHMFIEEVIVFTQQLVPEIATVGWLFADEQASHPIIEQISREQDTYPVDVLDPVLVTTAKEAVDQAAVLKDRCDALYIGPIATVLDTGGGDVLSSETLLFSAIKKAFGKATFANIEYFVKAGLLCGVKHFSREQGQVAAEMLQKAMSGTPVAELPITQNQFGQRVLNKTTLKELGITPSRQVLTGVDIVETIQ